MNADGAARPEGTIDTLRIVGHSMDSMDSVRWNSVEGNSCILAEFEFCSKFHWNCFVNLAGPSAKIDSSRIPGIAQIPAGISGGQ
jgi:hypothetical protein